ncbi:Protein N-acetyltransferase, RimJ/RimL family [Ekhidna lutea]|uniref:Protein N-acetyltransferase, RimJ/RimL family n=1 Tax=Ekhidna lutea TaxID=447679 RepID=A0A239FHH7_EKHLU|nr:GNAT family N-acetyltransferase [Ekhidna lutea]SNS56201.1 Protein N-acetyltransferase, RimJ/RimL family [Ekhidna lutea]
MNNEYKVLKEQKFTSGAYSIMPIRMEDRYKIMKWRNEQVYHLRQLIKLTEEAQDHYFENVVSDLFDKKQPNQILFSFLQNGNCIGYGGLVHINWVDMNAEISFLMETRLQKEKFSLHWDTFLELIKKVAYDELRFHKIYTYAFDLRQQLYEVLENAGFIHDATLLDHCFYESSFKNVVIHSNFKKDMQLRRASLSDEEITFKWASDEAIRKYSFKKNKIISSEHSQWFRSKISSERCLYFILWFEGNRIGSIRIDIENNEGLISYLLDSDVHGKGFGTILLNLAERRVKNINSEIKWLKGYVLDDNVASQKIFKKLGYSEMKTEPKKLEYTKKIV